jgi:mono/diheme cytochrome c family protein
VYNSNFSESENANKACWLHADTAVRIALLPVILLLLAIAGGSFSLQNKPAEISSAASPTFYRNVLPILQQHCQSCHRPGEIAPMPLVSYGQVRPFAKAIATSAADKTMPPWFADPTVGHFSNDPSMTSQEIGALLSWVNVGAPAGDVKDVPPPRKWAEGWTIPQPDQVVRMPKPVVLPAQGDIEYTYEIVPTGFTEDKWVQISEIQPTSRENVHHAVVYIRPPDSNWLRHAPLGTPFTGADMTDEQDRRDTHMTKADILLVYAPGSSPDSWPDGMAKFVPAGSDLVFQMHYMAHGHPASDQSSIGIIFAKHPPKQRVLTLQLTNDRFVIPPGVDDYRVEVHGSLPNDAVLLSFFPHMHLRGKRFEYDILRPGKSPEPLLRVNYNFYWQLSYRLAEPLQLQAGTVLQAVAWYDNSKTNPHNPDPDVAVRWGDQTYDEMMVGFFDVAVRADLDKPHYFVRPSTSPEQSH